MCFNCPDFVDICGREECYNPAGGPYSRMRSVYIGDRFCRHLQVVYGHEVATLEDQQAGIADGG